MITKGSFTKGAVIKKKIGILGGTFDPIHNGHLAFARAASMHCNLDKVFFIPANIPVLKKDKPVSRPEIRLEMTKLALQDYNNFEVSSIELERGGDTYTIDTLLELQQTHPENELFFLLSSDAAVTLNLWRKGFELSNYAHLVVSSRPQFEWPKNFDFSSLDGAYVHKFIPEPMLDISSSQIRHLVRKNKTINDFVPAPVSEFIAEHNLYQS